jgi:hypothetical protein
VSWYTFKEYLKYRWKAKTRHGVHSPFVFSFIEDVLRDKGQNPLEEKVTVYFSKYRKTVIDALSNKGQYELPTQLTGDSIVIVKNIYQDPQHATAWEQLIADPSVRMSINLFFIGLLFFKEDFKAKQHFILKYPG